MLNLEKSRAVLRETGVSGWLLSNMFHRDEIADLVLGVPREKHNTRPWLCILYADRPPVKIVHAIERAILDHVTGDTIRYSTRAELEAALGRALPGNGKLAADYSRSIPVSSYLDHGTALLLEAAGATLVSAEDLVARYLGTLDDDGKRSHDSAAKVLYAAVADAWSRLGEALRAGRALTEGDVQSWIAEAISAAGLTTDGPLIVGAGRHTNDPHFEVAGRGAAFAPGDTVQFDIWAKERTPGAVYADISWVGVCAASPSEQQARLFETVRDAREAAVSLLQERLGAGTPVTGADADRAAREVLISRGFASAVRHRTGHSIGGRVHGYGVNLDSVEFPDERRLTEGACFSIEPGLYLEELGMRTEIDCVVHQGALHISGPGRQTRLLTLG